MGATKATESDYHVDSVRGHAGVRTALVNTVHAYLNREIGPNHEVIAQEVFQDNKTGQIFDVVMTLELVEHNPNKSGMN